MSNKKISKLLVIRLSALGDVAMTVPVLYALSRAFPDTEITFVSQKFASHFINHINGISFFEADLKGRHKGFLGIIKLFFDLKRTAKFDAVADLHDVLRSKLLRFLFRLSLIHVAVIDKGRKEKRALCRIENKMLHQLDSSIIRYYKVLNKLGFDFNIEFNQLFAKASLNADILAITGTKESKWIGIAPFAKHQGKIYPLEKMMKVVEKLASTDGIKLFLFGGGKDEKALLEEWAGIYPNTISLAGKLLLEDEIKIISNLEVLLSMDSANMHLASLVNTSVISIWGATHPFAGFYGWNQDPDHAIQVDLPCRPCSVFGKKPCFRKDYACLNMILPDSIVEKILSLAHIH